MSAGGRRVSRWLAAASPALFATYAVIVAFTTYFCMYAYRKPFAVATYAGEAVGDPRTYGLDAAVGAAFLALLWPRLRARRNILVGVLGAAVALSMVPLTAPGVPVLAAGGVAVLVGVMSRRDDPAGVPDPAEETL